MTLFCHFDKSVVVYDELNVASLIKSSLLAASRLKICEFLLKSPIDNVSSHLRMAETTGKDIVWRYLLTLITDHKNKVLMSVFM